MENGFLKKTRGIIEENISNEQFGVSELAREAGMSRSNLLRRVKSLTGVSVSVFIRQVRLEAAMELLKSDSYNVNEVSYRVGFSSTSYFIKCFREHFGYPPGEVGRGKVSLDGEPDAESVPPGLEVPPRQGVHAGHAVGPPGLSGFFKEIKRRKVNRVITVYAAAAFVILELISIVVEPLRLPEWTLTMVIVLLTVGFIIAVVLSWIYDVGPDGGWVKTQAAAGAGEMAAQPGTKGWKIASIISFAVIAGLIIFNLTAPARGQGGGDLEKSIAVLPFKNDSNDSTNIYLINGLMESLLDNLQAIGDLRVISRTSVEKYRNDPKTIPEIASELNVSYLVDGSGQKIGDQILLNIQLIDATREKTLWAERYKREARDIFELQLDVARSIAGEIQAIITPREAEQLEKIPTQNLEAYDYFLKGLEPFYRQTRTGLLEAIPWFEKAVELDPEFARAHADLSIAYAFLDIFQAEKQYMNKIDYHADQALLADPRLPQSLYAKAMYHYVRTEYGLALPYLEKALEYHPNSSQVINILADYYSRFVPDTEKYLEYALMGLELDIAAHDSADISNTYLTLSNAFMQSGFVEEAEHYIELSDRYNPDNAYIHLLRPYILLAGGGTLQETRELLKEALAKDTSRADILKELGVLSFYMRDFEAASGYFSRMYAITQAQGLVVYTSEKGKFGVSLAALGKAAEAQKYLQEYLEFAENDQSIYKNLSLSAYYSYMGDTVRALENMRLFAKQENYPYWYILFLEMDDPLFDNLSELNEFQQIMQEINLKFWSYHKKIKESLTEKGLL